RAGGGDAMDEAATEHALVTNFSGLPDYASNPYGARPANGDYVGDPGSDGEFIPYEPINKNNFLTGLPGDPTTIGPFGTGDDALLVVSTGDGTGYGNSTGQLAQVPSEVGQGRWSWISRGTRITCPAGQAPRTILLAGQGQVNPDPVGVETCQ